MTLSTSRRRALQSLALLVLPAWLGPARADAALRVAVVGGIQLCGVWDRLAPRITEATGVALVLASAAPKVRIVPDFRSGAADLLLIHGGVESFELQAEGIGGAQRVWAANEHAIVGPVDDPAHVKGAADAAQAFERIAAAKAPFIAFRDPGSHEMVQNVWKRAGIQPSADWVLLDDTAAPQQVLELASRRKAYVVVGAIPVAFEKMRGEGLTVLLKGDPALRRYFVVQEPGPRHRATVEARAQARRVADFLTSPEGQIALVAADKEAGGPWLFPLPTSGGRTAESGPGSGRGDGSGGGRRRADKPV